MLICTVQIGVSFVTYVAISEWLTAQLDQNLLTVATQVVATLDNNDDFDTDDLNFEFNESGIAADTFLRDRLFFVRVVNFSTGVVLDASADYDLPIDTSNNLSRFDTVPFGSEQVRVYSQRFNNNLQYGLQVGQSLEDISLIQTKIRQLTLLSVIVTTLLAGLSGWFLAHRALVPVRSMTSTAQEISENDLKQRITTPLIDDELGQLGAIFNGMLDRIEGAFQRQKQFTADAAHELRTPLGILQTGLDVALERPRTAEEYQNVLENLRSEVGRMTKLTTSLLMLARSDSNEFTLHRQHTDLSLLMQIVSEQIESAAEEKQITITRDLKPNIIVNIDPDWIMQMLLNLLDNAVKYTPIDGIIRIGLERLTNEIELKIADNGIGIQQEHLRRIFDRFYRADRARSRQVGGFGLGLAMVHQIVYLHGGKIRVSSEVDRGTVFTISLPIS